MLCNRLCGITIGAGGWYSSLHRGGGNALDSRDCALPSRDEIGTPATRIPFRCIDMGSKFVLKNGPSLAMAIAFSLVFAAGLCVPLRAQVPGNELFAKEPQTPLELWDAVDYLLRTGQEKKALPYLERFVKGKPDDATLEMIRMKYGPSSILSLGDHPGTKAYAEPLAEAMIAAARKFATDPKRLGAIRRRADEIRG